MKEKKIAVIGVGGKTGTMFAFELRKIANVLGVGKEVEKLEKKHFFIKRKGEKTQPFKEKVILPSQWQVTDFNPDIIFLAIKNPIGKVIEYYYQKMWKKETLPVLILSQNGIGCVQEAQGALEEVLGERAKEVKIVRLNLFNPVDSFKRGSQTYITYSLPIRFVFGGVSGAENLEDLNFLFRKAGWKAQEIITPEVRNMELSKLFLNLIGMASASRGLSITSGFEKEDVFKEEIEALKEYIEIVRVGGSHFLNFSHYPVKLFVNLIDILPVKILFLFRNLLARIISRERGGKPKDLVEIEYYNGAVVNLAKKLGVSVPINQRVVNRWRGA